MGRFIIMKIFMTILLNACFYLGIAQQQQPSQNQALQFESNHVATPEMLDLSKFTNVNQTITLNNNRFILNVQFHSVNNDDGTAISTNYFGETHALNVIARLNEAFNVHNIFFKYRGLTTINNSNYSQEINDDATATAMKQQFINENKYDFNSINIFMIKHNYNIYNFYVGFHTFGADNTDILLADALNNPIHHKGLIPSLMGSSLGLLYVSRGSSQYATIGNNNIIPPCTLANGSPSLAVPSVSPSYWTNAENVTRNTSSPQYNATTKGDLVADTQASFYASNNNYCSNVSLVDGSWNMNNFVSHPLVKDQVGAPYVCTSNEGNNYLGNSAPYIGNNGLFTPGQVQRMKEYIEGNMNNIFRQKLNVFEDETPDISVLYEPFAMGGGGGSGSGVPTAAYSKTYSTNTTNTGANVWNCGPFTMRFQTGFNYEFSSPTGVVSQSIYQQYNTSTSTYVGVKIPILGQQVYTNNAPVCFYSFEPFTSGDVKSLNNLGTGVYTQEQLDEIKASDPTLYEQLQSGKYHIITKQTDSGFIDQKIIYKN